MKLSLLISSLGLLLIGILLSLTIAVPVDNSLDRKWSPFTSYSVACGGRNTFNYAYCGTAASIDTPTWINTTICETQCRCTNCGLMLCEPWFHCTAAHVKAVCQDHATANCMCQIDLDSYKGTEGNGTELQSGKNFPQPGSCVE